MTDDDLDVLRPTTRRVAKTTAIVASLMGLSMVLLVALVVSIFLTGHYRHEHQTAVNYGTKSDICVVARAVSSLDPVHQAGLPKQVHCSTVAPTSGATP